ncbi:hypothetical protein J2S17_001536 [Cytobacillus purgationiresistens]|uniref:Spermidine/putrescine ABC transporter ATP-binding protein n=1 Tax=Cytobacillus purgationiresistens TaxID=863449 RepID=A0ABU0AEI6_9BACI|nr:hypothetical protein [Cytobacillus purgationiresistens]
MPLMKKESRLGKGDKNISLGGPRDGTNNSKSRT